MDDKPLLNEYDDNVNTINDEAVIDIMKQAKLSAGNNSNGVWRSVALTPTGDAHNGLTGFDETTLLSQIDTMLNSFLHVLHPIVQTRFYENRWKFQ